MSVDISVSNDPTYSEHDPVSLYCGNLIWHITKNYSTVYLKIFPTSVEVLMLINIRFRAVLMAWGLIILGISKAWGFRLKYEQTSDNCRKQNTGHQSVSHVSTFI